MEGSAIKECGEPLVEIKNNEYFIIAPQYYQQGIPGAIDKMYVREGVYKRLVKAAQLLQKIKPGYKIVILDAWRPPKVQESLFNKYYTELWERNVKSGAGLTPAEIYEKTQQFVSVPSLDKKKPSPHFTGGAVDITYADERGNWSTMGTGFDDFTEKALNDYLERKQTKSKLNETEKEALENRRILYAVMKEAGFVSYREEWWHYDFGNQFAAEVARANGINMVAKYGLVKDLSNVKDIKEESVKTSRTDEPKRQKFFSELSR
ncbi:MAG: M15 family metallopeptidase [Clostridia bacterium]|nr:M15 family metallopeptidase [Clostridia bacterium]